MKTAPANIAGADALTVLALAGEKTERVELGTFVIPTYLSDARVADGKVTLYKTVPK